MLLLLMMMIRRSRRIVNAQKRPASEIYLEPKTCNEYEEQQFTDFEISSARYLHQRLSIVFVQVKEEKTLTDEIADENF